MDVHAVVRNIAKDIGFNAQDRREIYRILKEDDYASPFPISGNVTYAKALVLIDIIEDAGLPLSTSLPVLLSLVDMNLSPVAAPGTLKRACLRRIKSGKDLHERINSLYKNDDELGPFCSKIGIVKQWLGDQHEYDLEPGTVITNGVVLELYQHLKNSSHLRWKDAQRWLARLFPDRKIPLTQTIQSDWKRLQNKKNKRRNKAMCQELMDFAYKLPQRKRMLDEVEGVNVPRPSDETIADVDIFHTEYDSPIKKQLVELIRKQDETISTKNEELQKHHDQFSVIKDEYEKLLDTNKDAIKASNSLSYQLQVLQKSEDSPKKVC